MRSKLLGRFTALKTGAVVVTALFMLGWSTRPLEEPAWKRVRAIQPTADLAALEGAVGQGVIVGLLGGFRAILADACWIQLNLVWENKDLPASQTLITLVTAIDPRPLSFWLNGARMIAYDMPHWRVDAAGGRGAVSDVEWSRIAREQATLALRRLDNARSHHPTSPPIEIEIANIHLNCLKALPAATDAYHRAAEMPGAPFYAARIYAELLRKQGRTAEAYAWLKRIYPSLPKPGDHTLLKDACGRPLSPRAQAIVVDSAMADVVLGRIRELERELEISEKEKFKL